MLRFSDGGGVDGRVFVLLAGLCVSAGRVAGVLGLCASVGRVVVVLGLCVSVGRVVVVLGLCASVGRVAGVLGPCASVGRFGFVSRASTPVPLLPAPAPCEPELRVILSNRWLKLSGVVVLEVRRGVFSSSLFPKIFLVLVLPEDAPPKEFRCP